MNLDHVSNKVESVKLLSEKLGIDLANLIIRNYKGQYFENSLLRKTELFGNLIFTDSLNHEMVEFLETATDSSTLDHHRDTRNGLNYGINLILGWLTEDIVIEKLLCCSLNVSLDGSDRVREILPSSMVSVDPDFSIQTDGKTIPLELMIDLSGYWRRSKKCDVRSSKIERLVEKKGIFLGIDAITGHGFIQVFFNGIPDGWVFSPNHRFYGGKSVWTKTLSEDLSSFESLVLELIGL